MTFRAVTCRALAALLTLPPSLLSATPSKGALEGTVTLDSRPLTGVRLAFVELETGAVARTRTGAGGRFRADLPAGRYVIAAEGTTGLVVQRERPFVTVAAGRVASTRVPLVAMAGLGGGAAAAAGQEGAAPNSTAIAHDAMDCFVAGEYPVLDSRIEPASSVTRARIYFHSAVSPEWYFVEMSPGGAGFLAKLPPPRLDARRVTYYVSAFTAGAAEGRTEEITGIVVEDAGDCEGRVAPIGPPGGVTVFSAATGGVAQPLGFGLAAAAGGSGSGKLLALLGGAALAGIVAAIVVIDGEPSPSPSPTPSPGASPTPSPSPSPSPSPGPSPSPSPTSPPPPGTPFR